MIFRIVNQNCLKRICASRLYEPPSYRKCNLKIRFRDVVYLYLKLQISARYLDFVQNSQSIRYDTPASEFHKIHLKPKSTIVIFLIFYYFRCNFFQTLALISAISTKKKIKGRDHSDTCQVLKCNY